ncbi:MAG: ion channel [Planctomycetota bacterium]
MTAAEAHARIQELGGGQEWPVVLASAITIGLCVIIHYEAVRLLIRTTAVIRSTRFAIIATVLSLIIVHIVEIGIFGVGLAVLNDVFDDRTGMLIGDFYGTFEDYAYFSAAVYTTVGFGDVTPVGPIRTYAAAEALTGLVLVTWSASFTFLVMQARWRDMAESAVSS